MRELVPDVVSQLRQRGETDARDCWKRQGKQQHSTPSSRSPNRAALCTPPRQAAARPQAIALGNERPRSARRRRIEPGFLASTTAPHRGCAMRCYAQSELAVSRRTSRRDVGRADWGGSSSGRVAGEGSGRGWGYIFKVTVHVSGVRPADHPRRAHTDHIVQKPRLGRLKMPNSVP